MLESLRNNMKLLKSSKRHVLLFELAYKLLALAVFYPVITGVIRLCMRITGINYLTNEYIAKAFMNPVIIIFCLLGVIGFIVYCLYEMAYLAVCFETKRKGIQASIIDNIYNAFLRLKKLLRIQSIPLFLYFLISIIVINVTVTGNIIFSESVKNIIKSAVKRNRTVIFIVTAIIIICLFYFVIRDIFSFNIYMMEGKNFRQSCAKSRSIVKNNVLKIVGVVVLYNLALLAAIYTFYIIISVELIAGTEKFRSNITLLEKQLKEQKEIFDRDIGIVRRDFEKAAAAHQSQLAAEKEKNAALLKMKDAELALEKEKFAAERLKFLRDIERMSSDNENIVRDLKRQMDQRNTDQGKQLPEDMK